MFEQSLSELLKSYKEEVISLRQFITNVKSKNLFMNEAIEKTSFLDSYNPDILERLYYIINDLHDVVTCKYCNNKASWSGRIKEGYKEICSSKECRKKQLSDVHTGNTKISENRDEAFLEWQKSIIEVNDNIIKDIKYDRLIDLIDNQNILTYLDNRFKDSSSRLETYQRIKLGIEEKPKCPTCGKPVVWIGKQSKLYTTYCSDKCSANNENTTNKKKATQLKNWGTENCYDSEKYRNYLKETIGVEYHTQREDIKEKRKQTLLEHYKTTKLYQIESIRNKIIASNNKRFGHDSIFQVPEIRQRMYETCKENGTLGTSKAEKLIYQYLKDLGYNVIYQHRSEAFPYNVDFYLQDYDLYIEYQGSQYHHGSSYFGTKEDLEEVNRLQECHKALNKDKSQYLGMINTWTNFDVAKRNYAKNHHINFLEIYHCKTKEDLEYQIKIYLFCKNNENLYNFDNDVLYNEFNYYKNLNITTFGGTTSQYNNIVKQFQGQNFFKKEMEIFANDPILRRKLIQNRVKYLNKKEYDLTPNEILTGFKKSGIYYGYSHFNPQWTNWFVNKFNIKTIYDPCGGWGHHLLGMLNCDKIIYNDFSKSTVEGIQKMKDYFHIDNLDVHYGNATEYIPENVDGWFMCPPYYNLEHYECGDFKDINEYKEFLNKIMSLWQNSNSKIFGIIIREDLVDYIDLNYNEKYEIKIYNSHLGNKKKKEYFYIFNK